ncbi:MAG: hypothetical protein CM15mP78_03920 [Candidatus Poseidoniales archaeon]|nr:MAG: hypothetical protein CM15mP78_03920 [Candidatus Poseidoniales archaeon]
MSRSDCSISPSLPFGLSLNQGTCTISGTPTSHGSNITYNVTATSSTGVSKSGEFNLWITQIAPSISYTGSPFTFTVGTAISSITPTNTGDTAFWSVSPSLPSGLSLGAGGVISGTPSVEASAANYTITASNPGGESSATISITVNAQPPSGLSYATENMTLEKGTAMTANTASVGGGTVSSWEVFPLSRTVSPLTYHGLHQRHPHRAADHGGHLHRLGQQFRGLILGKREHHHQRCGSLFAELRHGEHDPDQRGLHEFKHASVSGGPSPLWEFIQPCPPVFRLATRTEKSWVRRPSCKPRLSLHRLGQQFRRLDLDHPEHHHQRRPPNTIVYGPNLTGKGRDEKNPLHQRGAQSVGSALHPQRFVVHRPRGHQGNTDAANTASHDLGQQLGGSAPRK